MGQYININQINQSIITRAHVTRLKRNLGNEILWSWLLKTVNRTPCIHVIPEFFGFIHLHSWNTWVRSKRNFNWVLKIRKWFYNKRSQQNNLYSYPFFRSQLKSTIFNQWALLITKFITVRRRFTSWTVPPQRCTFKCGTNRQFVRWEADCSRASNYQRQ